MCICPYYLCIAIIYTYIYIYILFIHTYILYIYIYISQAALHPFLLFYLILKREWSLLSLLIFTIKESNTCYSCTHLYSTDYKSLSKQTTASSCLTALLCLVIPATFFVFRETTKQLRSVRNSLSARRGSK